MLSLSTSPPRPPLLLGIHPLSAAAATITTITPSMMAAAAVSLSPLFRPKLVPNHYRVPSRSRIGRRHRGGVVSVSRSVLNGVAAAGGGSGSADDFRHPLDRQNTLILRVIPGLNEVGKPLLGSMAEQVMLLENIGTSVLVSKDQLADLNHLMEEAAQILNVERPDLYVRQSPVPNAYTLVISGNRPFVVVHTSLIELLFRLSLHMNWAI